jgi:hypothetical protein
MKLIINIIQKLIFIKGENIMSKFREVPCKYYVSANDPCTKNREASYKGYCQHCDKYEPRPHGHLVNRKKRELNKIRESEMDEE